MKLTGAATKPPPFSSPLPLLRHQSIRASRTRVTSTRPWKTAASGPTTTATSGGNAGNAGAADEESDRAPCVPSRLGARREARLSARRRESIKLLKALQDQEHGANAAAAGGGGGIGEFLRHPAGVESLLNTRALQSFAPLEPERNEFRCTLDRVQFLGFQVTPVLDVRVTPTLSDCTVELLSCRFEGSDSVEQQNELFSAFMRNHITWGEDGGEPCLDIDVNLEVTLEVYTKPFSLLPLSAVEKPGNLLMQGLLDRLVPMLGEQLLRDYHSWVQQQSQVSELQATVAE